MTQLEANELAEANRLRRLQIQATMQPNAEMITKIDSELEDQA